jgi:hypothetical protein
VSPIGVLRARWPTPLLLGLPVVLLAGAYVWLALEHHTWNLWQVIVHESGRYTLGQTVFFFRHFLREVPVDVAMGLFCAAAVAAAEPATQRRPPAGAAAILAVGFIALAFVLAAGEESSREALRDLLQFRTSDEDAAYGAHWNFHLLSTLWFGAAAPAAAALWAGRGGLVRFRGPARSLLAAGWGWVGLLTIVFGVHAEAFTSPRYIGHQAREILTHALITLPLTIGLLRWATGLRSRSGGAGAPVERLAPSLQVLAGVAIAGIPIFLVLAFRNADLATTAQMHSALAGVVAGHVFEHVLDMVLVVLVGLAALGAVPAPTAQQPVQ